MLLKDKVATVTGAASGIGRAKARPFAAQGASQILADVHHDDGEQRAEEAFRGLDTVFHNAGIEQPVTPSRKVAEELFDSKLDMNLKGAFSRCKHAIPELRRRGEGALVANSPVSAFASVGGNASYAPSKGAVMSPTRVLGIDDAENIRVRAIGRGVVDSKMNPRNLDRAENQQRVREGWMAVTLHGRMGTAGEVARRAVYLASNQSSFTTVIGLLIDEGWVAT